MEEIYNTPRQRITGAMISKCVGKNITVLGTVDPSQISSDGNSFKLRTDENVFVSVVLNAPLNELLDDLVEVTGKVDHNINLQCSVYRKLSSSVPFNFEDYNAAVEMMHRFPQLCTYQ